MNELNIEDINEVANLKKQIWQSFSIIRGDISSDQYSFILFLLLLQREGILRELPTKNRFELIKRIYALTDDNADVYKRIFSVYEDIINKISDDVMFSLVQLLGSLNERTLNEHFVEIFDDILYKLSKFQGKHSGEFIQPLELSHFICDLAELPKDAKIYNPFAGAASFGVFFNAGHTYIGQENNHYIWAIGILRLLAYKMTETSKFILGNSIENWNPDGEKKDLIIANPPLGMRIRQDIEGQFGFIRDVEQFLIEKGIQDLTPKGKLIVIVTQGVLFRSTDHRLRQDIIDNDLLEMVISFPGGLLVNTGIPIAILVINKDKKEKGVVRLIDASIFVDVINSREKKLNVSALKLAVKSSTESDFFKIVSNNKIKSIEYNLNVSRYFLKQYDGVALKDLCTFIQRERPNSDQIGILINTRDLQGDKFKYQLELGNIEEIPLSALKIQESALLLAIRGIVFKPTYFEFTGKPIFLNHGIIALKIDESKVDISYLINELHSDYVMQQMRSYTTGSVVSFITPKDLLSIQIVLPSIKEQKAKVAGIKESAVRLKLVEAHKNAIEHGLGNLIDENFASVKHSLGKPLMNIGSSLRNIQKALVTLDPSWETFKISQRLDVTLKDAFDSVYTNLDFIHSLLKNNERDFDVTNYPLGPLDIVKFVKVFVKKVESSKKTNIRVDIDINSDLKSFKNFSINGNSDLLTILFDNIVENANRHAFLDSSRSYKLQFRLGLFVTPSKKVDETETIGRFQSFLRIEVANNGVSFPENFTKEKFIRKNITAGDTGNTGLGGYDINQIVQYHSGDFDLITNDASIEFTTTYIILLPIE
jgi:type I restriction enzyme M protein